MHSIENRFSCHRNNNDNNNIKLIPLTELKYLHTSSVVWEGDGNSNSKTCCKLLKIESYSLLKINYTKNIINMK